MRKFVFYICIALSLLAYNCRAQTPFEKSIWLNETNTPVKVNCLGMDSVSYLWLGTDDGLYRYNGRLFSKIKQARTQPVTALQCTKSGIYIGYNDGVIGKFAENNFEQLNLKGHIPRSAITSIHVVNKNMYLLSTEGEGLFWINNGYAQQYTSANGLADDFIYSITPVNDKEILIATDQGINHISLQKKSGISITKYATKDGLPDNIVRVIRHIKGTQKFMVGTQQGGIALYNAATQKVTTLLAGEAWRWGQVDDILCTDAKKAWICTEEGYLIDVRLEADTITSVNSYSYASEKLKQLLKDKTGNIWCATNNGVKLTTGEYMYNIPLASPYSLSQITAMACDKDNNIWFALGARLYKMPLGTNKPELQHTLNTSITNLHTDGNNTLWIGTFNNGLWKKENNRYVKANDIPVLQDESILDIASVDDKLWVAGLNGVQELNIGDQNRLQLIRTHNKNTGVGSDYVYQVFVDKNKTIWMATDGAGVCNFRNGEYLHWDSAAGMNSKVIYSITQDAYGNIWASSSNEGLLTFDGKRWSAWGRDEGLNDLNIYSLAADDYGKVLVVHGKGIDEFNPRSKQFKRYYRRQNIGIDSSSKNLKLYASDNSGNIYIPYDKGFVRFENKKITTTITPAVSLNNVSIFLKSINRRKNKFSSGQNHITFNFEGINFANPEHPFYRYKLEGFNNSWIDTRDEAITFPQLPHGDYKFLVQVSNNLTHKTYGQAQYSFSIARPLWMQAWFLVIAAVLIWAASFTYIRLREKNLRKLALLQKERMQFEYEHLKSQVNPHFLFNSLNTLTNLIEDDQTAALQYTSQLSDLYRNMLSFRDKDLIHLSEEWEIVENYIYIQQSRFGSALAVKANVPVQIRKTKKIIPMALQLLIENAIKHNIVSMSQPLIISIEAKEDILTIKNNYQPKISKEKGAGLGLMNIRNRYKLLTRIPVVSQIKNDEFIVEIPLL